MALAKCTQLALELPLPQSNIFPSASKQLIKRCPALAIESDKVSAREILVSMLTPNRCLTRSSMFTIILNLLRINNLCQRHLLSSLGMLFFHQDLLHQNVKPIYFDLDV